MPTRSRLRITVAVAATALLSTACGTTADSGSGAASGGGEPVQSLRVMVPNDPGGGSDGMRTAPVAHAPTSALREALQSKDPARYVPLLAQDVTLSTPVEALPFTGREEVAQVLQVALSLFDDFRYVDQVDGDDLHVLEFEMSVAGHPVEGVDLLRFDEHGLVTDVTVMMRPLESVEALRDGISARMPDDPPADLAS